MHDNCPVLPSQTVENYLKTIYLAQASQTSADELVPVGQLATALRVVPGTATTMMKALAEAGLVRYEPYMGVRLTTAGEKLATLVLRRHRLIELFLVKILGMSWAEVHDEAEALEHAVSERLIDRIDEMLGQPEVDPHGDPIPTAEGHMPHADHLDLLSAPLGVRLTVTRVIDQDPGFLRFVEEHQLMPGFTVTVDMRESASDAVRLRADSGEAVSIGARAAAKIFAKLAG
jgi:DtxR family transcriptional regulator, Mn-dependent transcriptional regulator